MDFALKSRNATVVVTSATFQSRGSPVISSFLLKTLFSEFLLIVAAERKTSYTNICGRALAYCEKALITAAQTGSQGRFTLKSVDNHAAR